MGDHPLRPPTHRRLGEPLPHQLANGTHAHPLPSELSPLNHAIPWAYGALIRISPGYSPVKGRLHTRYAPVRRSQVSEETLPLDLHVLGLPLAFILSQDQTLRCIITSNFKSSSMFVFILKNAVSLFLNTSKNLSCVISKNSRPYSSTSFINPELT